MTGGLNRLRTLGGVARFATPPSVVVLAGVFIAAALAASRLVSPGIPTLAHTSARAASGTVRPHGRSKHRGRGTANNSRNLTARGNIGSRLYPGDAPVAIDVSLSNPHDYRLTVTTLTVSLRSVSAPHATSSLPCTKADFAVRGYTGRGFTAPAGPGNLAHDHVLRSRWPRVAMLDRPVNQNGCMGALLRLDYHATATRHRVAR